MNMKKNTWIKVASLCGFLGVVMGALGAHGLEPHLDSGGGKEMWEKAVRYQIFHSLALLIVVGASLGGWVSRVSFLSGIIFFSGTLYLLALGVPSEIGFLTPIGGAAFLIGWLGLFQNSSKNSSS